MRILQVHSFESEEEHLITAGAHPHTPESQRKRNSGNFFLSDSWSSLHEDGNGKTMAMDMGGGGGGGAQANQAADLEEIETSVRIDGDRQYECH